MRRLTALWAVLAFLALVFHGTTTASAASFTYDAPTIARVEVHEFDAPANPGRFSDARAGSASPSVEGRGTFTTHGLAVVATEAGINAEGGVGAAAYGPQVPGGTKPTPNFKPPTNPPQLPPSEIPPGWRVREMPPTAQYPDGYWKLEKPMPNGGWQPIDPSTMKPGGRPETHVPFPSGG